MPSTNIYPYFIPDKPAMEGQVENTMPRIIGLEGGWGTGKSNVVRMVEDELKKEGYYTFTYDAWGHQEDLQHRSILEAMTSHLIDKQILQGKVKIPMRSGKVNEDTWKNQLSLLLSNKTATVRKSMHSLRSYNFFKLPVGIQSKCNVGGFGIDGGVSTMISASFAYPEELFIGVFGDLAFFYDMNVIGNRHVGNNVRILLINNGKGNEFRNYQHPCCFLGVEAEDYVAAARHYGNKSDILVKNYAENLGYEYMTANSKESFLAVINRFLTPELTNQPMLLEVFTETQNESDALEKILNIVEDNDFGIKIISKTKSIVKSAIRETLGDKRIKAAKDFIKG